MVLFNYSTRELTAKIVYYGPGLCGKTTNLQFVHENLPGDVRGKMLSLATKTDRTLFFDFLPIDLGEIRGMKTRVQLYTVPGQVFYNETRKLVLKGADGIVFVADSQETMLGANVESFKNLEENLKAHGMKLGEMPHVIQFNKRDLPKLSAIEDLNAALNKFNAPFYESVAVSGIGVQDTLKAIVKLVLLQLTRKYDPKSAPASAERPATASAPRPEIAAPVAASAARSVATSSARSATPVAQTVTAPPATREQQPMSIPVSSIAAPPPATRGTAPPPPSFARTPAAIESLPSFAQDEIDGLVDEVGDSEAPMLPASEPDPLPVAAAGEGDGEEDGVWLGGPEADDASFGSNIAIEDLLTEDRLPSPAAAPIAPVEPAWREAPSFESSFEVDRGFDPETRSAEAAESVPLRVEPIPVVVPASDEPIAPFPIPTGDQDDEGADDVLLTEVASGDDLFNDPTLEVAHLADGSAREIIVPVMLGEGLSARRFKLAIRLRLDPVD